MAKTKDELQELILEMGEHIPNNVIVAKAIDKLIDAKIELALQEFQNKIEGWPK